MMNIYVHTSFEESERNYLREAAPDAHFHWRQDLPKAEHFQRFCEAEICIGNIRPEWIPQSQQLRWLCLESIGFDQYLSLDWPILGKQVQMTHLKGFFAIAGAESALANILVLYRKIDHLARLQIQHEWMGGRIRKELETLYQKRVLILGPGAIGQRLKQLLVPFECEVTMFGRRPSNADITTLDELDAALPTCEVLVNILPGTPATTGLLDRHRLGLLSSEAIFVNIGRGTAVDESALIEYLNNGHIKGCVADVTIQEPLPADHPAWDCPNLLLTQHSAGGDAGERSRKVIRFVENLERYRSGNPLLNIADVEKGY